MESSSKLTLSAHGKPHRSKARSSIANRSSSTCHDHKVTQAASTARRRCSSRQTGASGFSTANRSSSRFRLLRLYVRIKRRKFGAIGSGASVRYGSKADISLQEAELICGVDKQPWPVDRVVYSPRRHYLREDATPVLSAGNHHVLGVWVRPCAGGAGHRLPDGK